MCNNCIHKAVCSIYRATGGVKKCEHFKEERKGKWIEAIDEADYDYGICPFCGFREREYFPCMYIPNFCPNCGADMRGAEDGN